MKIMLLIIIKSMKIGIDINKQTNSILYYTEFNNIKSNSFLIFNYI